MHCKDDRFKERFVRGVEWAIPHDFREETAADFLDEFFCGTKRPLLDQMTERTAEETSLRFTDDEREVVRIDRSLLVTLEVYLSSVVTRLSRPVFFLWIKTAVDRASLPGAVRQPNTLV